MGARAIRVAVTRTGRPFQRSKYRAIPTMVDGIKFASGREARRYMDLKLLQCAGEISGLELQPVFPLIVDGVQVGKYLADFRYYKADGELVIEDSKGFKTPTYRLKKRIVEAQYGIEVKEV